MDKKFHEKLVDLKAQVEQLGSSINQIISSLDVTITSKDEPVNKNPRAYANSLSDNKLIPIDLTQIETMLLGWPRAVDPALITDQNDEDSLQYRALQILSIMPISIKDLNVLDIGCGTGHLAVEMSYQAKSVVAYDVDTKAYGDFSQSTNLTFAQDIEQVQQNGPYDFIVMYDVLDHAKGDPLDLLKTAQQLIKQDGTIFLRTHPWVSNTGGHLYETMNYGFLHLYLTPYEMSKLGYKLPYNIKATRPMAMYEDWINRAGLKIESRTIKAQPINDFFKKEAVINRIIQVTWADKIQPDQALKILKNDTIDYVLKNA